MTIERDRLLAALPWGVGLLWLVGLLLLPVGVLPALGGTDGAGDFQWSGAHLLSQGVDPYQVVLQHRPGIIRSQSPNYLHALYVALLPLGILPFSLARVLWTILNLGMFATSVVLLGRGVGLRGWALAGLGGLLVCSMPFLIAMHAGQQTALVTFTAVVGYRARAQLAQGAALALTVTKYSFAPIAVMLLMRKRWGALLVLAAIAVGSVGVISVWTGSGFVTVAGEPLRVGRGMSRGAADTMSMSGLLLDAPRTLPTYVVAVTTALVLVWLSRRVVARGQWVDALACTALVSLIAFPHLVYDTCLLLPVLASSLRLHGRARAAVLLVVGYFWFNWLVGGFPLGPYSTWGVATNLALLAVAFFTIVRSADVPSEVAASPCADVPSPAVH